MKKLIFLLILAVAFVGIVSAHDTAHPHGDFSPEIVLAEFSAQQGVVTQPAVLVSAVLVTAWLSSFQAAMALYNESAMPLILDQAWAVFTADCYYLRC